MRKLYIAMGLKSFAAEIRTRPSRSDWCMCFMLSEDLLTSLKPCASFNGVMNKDMCRNNCWQDLIH